ncbi:hypothetical protein [Brevibacterium jeotgali]|nr:hypothetical protein [Brevibacterium jeotgali]
MHSLWSHPHPTDPAMTCSIHRRVTDGGLAEAAELLSQIASGDDTLWPTWRWPALLLDNGLEVDSLGGHGSVRYRVADIESHRVRFVFTSAGPFAGEHTFLIAQAEPGAVEWMHHLDISSSLRPWAMRQVIRLHDGLLEDLFDTAQARMAGRPVRPRPLSPGFALLQRAYRMLEREP